MRPVLVPAARRLWRDRESLQLGRPSGRAVVVEGLDPARRALLPLLDGLRTREQVLTAAAQAGCTDAPEVLDLLDGAGLLLDADALRAPGLDRAEADRLAPDLAALSLLHGPRAAGALLGRRQARVVVHGGGRVGGPLAALLAEAGVGTVDVRDDEVSRPGDTAAAGLRAEDVGRPRGQALAARLRSVGSHRRPDLVVLTDDAPEQTAAALAADGMPHLLARVDELVGLVGPLVLPGHGPCLHCLELVRSSLDPAWPALSAQLSRPGRGPAPCDGVLAAAVAAQAALQVLQLLEGGEPAAVGGTLELELPGWRWRRRSWPQHPDCPCAWSDRPPLAASA